MDQAKEQREKKSLDSIWKFGYGFYGVDLIEGFTSFNEYKRLYSLKMILGETKQK